MQPKPDSPLSKIKISRVFLPTLIGVGVVVFLMFRNFNMKAFDEVTFNFNSVLWLLVATLLMFFRDFGYVLRIRVLTDNKLSWLQAFRVVFLWEFTSAITPSAIGGTSVAILYVNKEGVSIGKSTAVVMATSFLDEMYFVILFPILLLIINNALLLDLDVTIFGLSPMLIALIGYSLKLLWVLLISYGLFVNPRGLKWLILKVFKLPFLRRWRSGANNAGDEIIVSSKELKQKNAAFWLKAFGATFFSWTSRYWVLNAMFLAFFAVSDHFLLFARQLVMWIMMLVSPTPGGSGFSEYVFTEYLSDFLPGAGLIILMALLWRLITYYPYLIIGAFLFPRWIALKFKRRHNKA